MKNKENISADDIASAIGEMMDDPRVKKQIKVAIFRAEHPSVALIFDIISRIVAVGAFSFIALIWLRIFGARI